MSMQVTPFVVRRGCHPANHAVKMPTYDFEIAAKPGGYVIWAGAGFISEKNRDDAVNVALKALKEKA